MDTPPSAPDPTPHVHRRSDGYDRKAVRKSALLLLGAVLLGVVLVAIFLDPGDPDPREKSNSIPQPNSGKAPEHAGDRGGWEQLALLGLIVVATTGGGYLIFRGGGSEAKARRQAWAEAAKADHDGALER